MVDNHKNLWTFKSKGSESAFGGNEGYPDDPHSNYVYDTTVKNHDKVLTGDLVVVADKRRVIGVGTIEEIRVEENISKVRFRCPVCRNQEIATRKNITPKYKCRKKHEFDEPVTEQIVVTRFNAYYGSSFISVSGVVARALKPYYINHNLYYSIQKTELAFLLDYLPVLEGHNISKSLQLTKVILPAIPYEPDDKDERKRKTIVQPTREGQDKFRAILAAIYGTACMLTGCTVMKAIEASHINPYKGLKDNHPENGLLFRKDLHALFDSNLLGIDPDTLTVRLHPVLQNTCYQEFAGRKLIITHDDIRPSKTALKIRWQQFYTACKGQRFL